MPPIRNRYTRFRSRRVARALVNPIYRQLDPDIPLIDQLTFVPVEWEPEINDEITPEIMAQRIAEIQATWDDATRRMRSTGSSLVQDIDIQRVSMRSFPSKTPIE